MKSILKMVSAITLGFGVVATAFATPNHLVTTNNTNEESNAFIAGTPSPYPTKAHSTNKVYWNLVRLACFGHSTDNKCSAVVKMATNTANPITIGTLSMDLTSGDINPKRLSNNGYTIVVNGLGSTIITKD